MAILILLSFTAACGAGFLQVRNYPASEYEGGPQNWAFAQDSLGRIYIGNRDGMLAFDGEQWHKYTLPNLTTVRSLLYVASENRIYAAGTDEFGYYESTDLTGELVYNSLTKTLPKTAPNYTEIWHIHRLDKYIYFQTDNDLFRYDGQNTVVIKAPERISTSAVIDNRLYVGTGNGSLLELKNNSLVRLRGTGATEGLRIQALLPGIGLFIIATPLNGLFIYNGQTASPLQTELNEFLKANQLFCAVSDGKCYAFGTVSQGIVVKDFNTGRTRYANRSAGMLNNTVLNAAFDKTGNLWLGLDNGLDYVLLNSPATTLIGASNNIGAGYTSFLSGPHLYMGTNQGLFETSYPLPDGHQPVNLNKYLSGQIWSITGTDHGFFVSGDDGIYFSKANTFQRINGLQGGYRVRLSGNNPDRALASCYDGFHLLLFENGVWQDQGLLSGDSGIRGEFIVDRKGYIWVNNWLKGIYRLTPDIDRLRFDRIRLYNSDQGLPSINGNSMIAYRGDITVSCSEGFYTWDAQTDKFVRHPQLNSILKGGPGSTLHSSGHDDIGVLNREGLQVWGTDSTGELSLNTIPFRGFRDKIMPGYEAVNLMGSDVLMGTQTGFWLIDSSIESAHAQNVAPFVNLVTANRDSIVYRAPLTGRQGELKLPFELRSLRFEIGYPDYIAPEEITFATWLEKYEKDWGPFSSESVREYTQLSEGDYILHIRVRNKGTGKTEEAHFRFRILPPWYRSVPAKVIYTILAIAIILLIIWLGQRWKLRTEKALESAKQQELEELRKHQEREALQKDYEIASLKSKQLELDIKHKSGELSTATMNLIRKNEMLTDMAAQISKIQAEPGIDKNARRELDHLQKIIRENISHDIDWSDLSRNFDLVYNNYTQRLHETYPVLTAADIRLCCFIKLGLTSKDIAPLLNISVKSVEMARYRLRKKMNLDGDTNLADHLTNF